MNQQEKIKRNEFLKKLGFSGAALFALYTLDSCQNESNVAPLAGDITVDLADASNAQLKTNGGYVIKNGVVIARVNATTYIAATLTCSHEGKTQITFKNNEWYCTAHGARFDQTGKGLNTEGKKGLKIYQTTLLNSTLTVKAA
ncbi:Rieske Fe-S protein [Runella defluvii]|uniref:Rieske Fe-S protein n=1 Tax=Runella defluvii TaxID=370973 RepID=A0A7W6ERI4_9BACT|nr:Rieske 2Fe-2S domain-containing protein [Runella defluvii]MBB3839578.1 Rieske Fe-S protein [Runella defluvii]